MTSIQALWHERGGTDGPLLVLLHGLGANGTVWDGLKPLLVQHWPGRWLIPDFRGHGRSFHRGPYSFGMHAADVASLLEQDGEVTVVGHSMGGVVAIALATGLFGAQVKQAIAFSVKVDWTEDDISKAQMIAQAPPKTFARKEDAIERYLRVSGLKGLVPSESPAAEIGIREQEGQFRLATNPRVNAIAPIDFVRIAHAATSPLHLLCGEMDNIADPVSMRRLGAYVETLPGLGHNPHIEAPEVLWQALARECSC